MNIWNHIKFFNKQEFECKCGCGCADMDPRFLLTLDTAREEAGVPFIITSGYRCAEHNKRVGGVADSAHTKGMAADISILNNQHRFALLKVAFKYFKRVGLTNTFIHVDNDHSKAQHTAWPY